MTSDVLFKDILTLGLLKFRDIEVVICLKNVLN